MKEEIIEALRRAGGRLARSELIRLLFKTAGRPPVEFWAVEQELVDEKRIERRVGRRGGIYLMDPPATVEPQRAEEPPAAAPDAETRAELGYYQPILDVISQHWPEEYGFSHVFGAITAGQGRRPTGGRWSRPDLVICTVSDWVFSSRPEGEVRTIEVKRWEALDVLAVYEALSHRSRAHYSYLLVVNFPRTLDEDQKADFDAVLSVAGRHGVGVIRIGKAEDWDTWSQELEARRSDADQQAVNQLLLDQVPKKLRDDLRQTIRTGKIVF